MLVSVVVADKTSSVPSKRLVIVTFREVRFVLSTSVTLASTSVTATAPASSVKVAAKLAPAVTESSASRSTADASLAATTVNVVVAVLLSSVPSFAVKLMIREVVSGVSFVF